MTEGQETQTRSTSRSWSGSPQAGVAKSSGMVCVRVPHPSRPGKRRTRVWEAGATTGAVLGLGEQLAGEGIEMVTLEATSDYWRI